MEDVKTYVKDLTEGILDRYIPIADNLSSLLDPDPVRATKVIVRLLKKAIRQFCYYLPLAWETEINMDDTNYTFIDNYFLYARKEITFDQLQLIPDAIARLGLGSSWEITANFWRYDRPTLKCSEGTYVMKAVYEYPLYCEYDQNGLLRPTSHIYGLSRDIMNQFENMLDYTFISNIKARSNIVKLPLNGAEFLNFDDVLQTLSTAIDEDKQAASTLGLAWL